MRIGFDFDNTIVCYDQAIEILSETLELPNDLSRNKLSIRDYLRSQNRENEWTKFQGTLYGPGMQYASAYTLFFDVAYELKKNKHDLFIVSHRSKYPYSGEEFDLHKFAMNWIELQTENKIIFDVKNIYFLNTLESKIKKINELNIDLYIDDLIEVINHEIFPTKTKAILFDPWNNQIKFKNRIKNWNQLSNYV
jgi:hypothetical protein